MRPIAVLILALGASSALLFAILSLTGGPRPQPQAAGPTGPAEADAIPSQPAVLVDAPIVEAIEPLPGAATGTRAAAPTPGGGAFSNAIQGRVVDEQGRPIADAEVLLTHSEDSSAIGQMVRLMGDGAPEPKAVSRFTTTESGEFRFGHLDPGKWALIVRHADYAEKRVGDIELEAETQATEIVQLGQGFQLAGFVLDAGSGAPIDGALLVLDDALAVMTSRTSGRRLETRSRADGSYLFENVTPSNLALVCSAKGYGTQVHSNLALFFDKDQRRKEKNVELEPGRIIAGRVVTPSLQGVKGARIEAIRYNQEYTSRGVAVSREDGEFVIEDLAEGVYTLRIDPKSIAGWDADPKLKVDAGTTDVEIQVFEQGTVSGRVIDAETGKPLRSFRAVVRLIHPTTRTYGTIVGRRNVRNAEDGRFSIKGISENTYVVQADADGYASSFSEMFTVTQGMETPDVVVRMTKGGTIRGKVLDSYTGEPVAGAQISTHENRWIDSDFTKLLGGMAQSPLSQRTTKTDEKGEFELELMTPGTYQVRIQHPEYTNQIHDDVVVHDGDTRELGPFLLAHGAVVSGTVYDGDGLPGRGMTVFLRPMNGEMGRGGQTRTDAEGHYVLKNVAPGSYKLSASRPRDELTGSPFDTILDMKNSEVEVSFLDGQDYVQDLYLLNRN